MNYDAELIPAELCGGFELAICKACKPCPPVFNASFDPGQNCSAPKCPKPAPSPSPSPPPPAPPGGTPCIRFGNAIASDDVIDATITQGAVSHTWNAYRFAQFSDWVSVFHGGQGTITLKDASGATLLTTTIPLTPGPLVVVVKGSWPPKEQASVETIAASFVPPKNGSKVRMFNLAMDVPEVGLVGGDGMQLVDHVKYSLGSDWMPVSTAEQQFAAVADSNDDDAVVAAALATATFTPPAAPDVFTSYLLGSKSFGYSLLPQFDAPETGPCKPPSFKTDENVDTSNGIVNHNPAAIPPAVAGYTRQLTQGPGGVGRQLDTNGSGVSCNATQNGPGECLAVAAAACSQTAGCNGFSYIPSPSESIRAYLFAGGGSTARPTQCGTDSHWWDCHFADTLSASTLKHLLKVEGGAAK